MLEDMRVRNFSPHTQSTYVLQVSLFARYFHKPPDLLGPEEIRSYQVYLTDGKKLAPSSILIAVAALRFLYKVTLHKDWSVEDIIPAPKKPQKLPVVLSPEEVRRFLSCVASSKHRTILTTCYAAGLRISEVVQLTPTDIDSQRMVIRVEQGRRTAMSCSLPSCWRFCASGGACRSPSLGSSQETSQVGTSLATLWSWRAEKPIEPPVSANPPVTPHSLRHAFSVHLLEQGTDVRRIQLLLGHRSLATTARYLKIATSQVCSTTSPFDLLPQPVAAESKPAPPQFF
jgi:site-specific recombinase XerD